MKRTEGYSVSSEYLKQKKTKKKNDQVPYYMSRLLRYI